MRDVTVYIAASSSEIDRVLNWSAALRYAGVRVVSTWPETIALVGDANPRDATRQQRREWVRQDLAEVDNSRLVWFLVPPIDKPTRGAWVELGYNLGAWTWDSKGETRLVCSGDTKQSIFCALGEEFASDEEAFAWIVERAGRS